MSLMLSKEELSALREDYSQRGLRRAELDADPLPIRLRNGAARLLQPYL